MLTERINVSYVASYMSVHCMMNTINSERCIKYIVSTNNLLASYVCVVLPVTLKPGKPQDDPDALLQQYIPQSYLRLQNEVEKKVLEMKKDNLAPMMNKKDYQ